MKLYWVILLVAACAIPTRAGTLAQFRTVFGDVEVELLDQDKPVTVSNFVQYVKSGRYRDTFIHRCVTNFVIQGGGFVVTGGNPTNISFAAIPTYPPIPNEFGVGARYSNVYGTIAMAKVAGNTNSATSQWYFNLADNTFLDAANSNNFFTVFGRVVRGTNALDSFQRFVRYTAGVNTSNVIINLGGAFAALPLRQTPVVISNVAYLADSDIVYVDVSLLNVQVAIAEDGGREISWRSVSEITNRVEFTEAMPPVWETLLATNGNGGAMKVLDRNPGGVARFYRVRVDY